MDELQLQAIKKAHELLVYIRNEQESLGIQGDAEYIRRCDEGAEALYYCFLREED